MAYLLVPLVHLDAENGARPVFTGGTHTRPGAAPDPAAPAARVVDLTDRPAPRPASAPPLDALAAWVAVATASPDACLVVDRLGRCAAVSPGAALLLGHPAEHLVGRDLGADLLDLLDFSDGALGGSGSAFVPQIPPLLALTSNVLTRGLLRLRRPDGGRVTLDAVAAPLHDGDSPVPVGAVSFLLAV